ncbi:MAG: hypothetical protein JNL47_10720 [Bacteroidia bacterium]|nr:hypothetical protein [Bacteroidia bacterium]
MLKTELVPYPNIAMLNQEKFLINFVYREIKKGFASEKLEVADEIFEMLRTANGIDFSALHKVRIRRLKPAETKAFLTELDAFIKTVLDSKEFQTLAGEMDNSHRLYDKLMLIKAKLSSGDLQESEKESGEFRNMIAAAGTGDIMIALFRLFNPNIKVRQPHPEIKLNSVKLKESKYMK